jgi:hypothetical protein
MIIVFSSSWVFMLSFIYIYNFVFFFLLLRVWDITCPRHMTSSTLNFGLVNYRNLEWMFFFTYFVLQWLLIYVLQITQEFQAVNISVKTDIWRSKVRVFPPFINSSWHFICFDF